MNTSTILGSSFNARGSMSVTIFINLLLDRLNTNGLDGCYSKLVNVHCQMKALQ